MVQDRIRQEYNNFCHNIVWLRKHHNLSKKEMAKLLGIGIGSLNKLEHGEIPPRMTTKILNNINRHFNIPISEQFSKRLGK